MNRFRVKIKNVDLGPKECSIYPILSILRIYLINQKQPLYQLFNPWYQEVPEKSNAQIYDTEKLKSVDFGPQNILFTPFLTNRGFFSKSGLCHFFGFEKRRYKRTVKRKNGRTKLNSLSPLTENVSWKVIPGYNSMT